MRAFTIISATMALLIGAAPASDARQAAGSPPAAAQRPAPESPPASGGQPTAPATAAAANVAEPQGFTYDPQGRRDPFVSLLRRGAAGLGPQGSIRPAGLAGLGVGEVTLRGTVKSQSGFVAILEGSDNKTYIVRPGDKLLDGTIRSINENDIVILQQVNDPLSLQKQREVRKVLRQTEEGN